MANGIVPWIQAADPARNFLQAYQAGAQISSAKARMAQSAAEADREYALQQQAMQEKQDREQRQAQQDAQQLEVTKAYREQQMQLQQQKLDQAKQYNDQRIQQASQKFTSQQQAQQEMGAIDDAVANGDIDEDEGRKQKIAAIVRNSAGTGAAAGPALQTLRPQATFGKSPGGQEFVTEPTGEARWGAAPQRMPTQRTTTGNADTTLERSTLSQIAAVRQGLLKGDIPEEKGAPALKSLQQTYDAIQKRRADPTATGAAPTAQATDHDGHPVIKDKTGKAWTYTGTSADPKSDKDKSHWKAADQALPKSLSILKDEPVQESSHDEGESGNGEEND